MPEFTDEHLLSFLTILSSSDISRIAALCAGQAGRPLLDEVARMRTERDAMRAMLDVREQQLAATSRALDLSYAANEDLHKNRWQRTAPWTDDQMSDFVEHLQRGEARRMARMCIEHAEAIDAPTYGARVDACTEADLTRADILETAALAAAIDDAHACDVTEVALAARGVYPKAIVTEARQMIARAISARVVRLHEADAKGDRWPHLGAV